MKHIEWLPNFTGSQELKSARIGILRFGASIEIPMLEGRLFLIAKPSN